MEGLNLSVNCSVSMEWVTEAGAITKAIKFKNAAIHLVRNEFRDIFLAVKTRDISRKLLLKDVTVHKKFMHEGKATIKFSETRINLLISNAPATDLVEFLKVLFVKLSSKKSSPKVALREKLLSLKPQEIQEISPINGKDIDRVKKEKAEEPPSKRGLSYAENQTERPAKKMCLTPMNSLSDEQKKVLEAVKRGGNVFFTGSAGTGKSYLLRSILNALPPESTAATASTGAAACLIGGTTLHSFAGIGSGEGTMERCRELARRPGVVQNWRRARHLIIDEISMVDAPFFEKVEAIGREVRSNDRPFGGLQLIVCGDFLQLPPVTKGVAGGQGRFCFSTEAWSRCAFQVYQLREAHRQADPHFVTMLNEIRIGAVSSKTVEALSKTAGQDIEKEGILATRLCSHTNEARAINESRLEQLQGEEKTYEAVDSSSEGVGAKMLDDCTPVERRLRLKVGAQVMLLKNTDLSKGLVNGARGRIEAFANGLPVVKFVCGVKAAVKPEKWSVRTGLGGVLTRKQIPLRLAWAFSIHKSQGLTLDCVEMNLSKTFEAGQAYVALSRAKSLDSLRVLGFAASQVWADPDVLRFYRRLDSLQVEYIPLGRKVGAKAGGGRTLTSVNHHTTTHKGEKPKVKTHTGVKPNVTTHKGVARLKSLLQQEFIPLGGKGNGA